VKNAIPASRALGPVLLAAAALLTAGCGQGKPAAAASGTIYDHFRVDLGGHAANLQVAVSNSEKERGLMQRPDLGPDDGMIFVDESPQRQNFWMKNTPESLDIAFAAPDGTIVEIHPLYPFDMRTVSSNSDQLLFAVEMPQGWFAAKGVRAGEKIDVKAVASALRDRGYDPAKFGL
jgi:hypothetical protein